MSTALVRSCAVRCAVLAIFALLTSAPAAQAQTRTRFEGRTFHFANRTPFSFYCHAYVNDALATQPLLFAPNTEHSVNLPPDQELTLQCPGISGDARIVNLLPLRRYLFLRRGGAVALFDVTVSVDTTPSGQ